MDLIRAFQVLDLPFTASEEEIRDRYRQMSKVAHPDQGGDGTAFAELKEAHDVALSVAGSKSLVPLSTVAAIVETSSRATVAAIECQQSTRKATRQIIDHLTRGVRWKKRYVAIAGVASGVAAVISQLTSELQSVNLPPLVRLTTATSAALLGLIYLMLSGREQRSRQFVEDVGEMLDDKEVFHSLIRRVLEMDSRTDTVASWSREQIYSLLQEWHWGHHYEDDGPIVSATMRAWRETHQQDFATAVFRMGTEDFGRLLLLKGIGHGLITEETILRSGRLLVRYSLKYPLERPEKPGDAKARE